MIFISMDDIVLSKYTERGAFRASKSFTNLNPYWYIAFSKKNVFHILFDDIQLVSDSAEFTHR